jgi:UDP-N-acetylglucosamine 2-epimerase (non-hydrolysing)
MTAKTILCIVGTRPEVIKMAPVILALKREPWANVRVLATAQHREMLDSALAMFDIVPDIDLDLMRPGQQLAELTARLLMTLDGALEAERPAAVLAQGDTTTVLASALACFYRRIPFCHVEAGLRTGDFANPFPEEMNRTLAGRLTALHFSPTERARDNLLAEGIQPESIHVTGNTVIDALLFAAARMAEPGITLPSGKRIVLLTAHRRENFGEPLKNVFRAVHVLLERHPDLHFIYPVHPNPNVVHPAREAFAGTKGVTLCDPLDYMQLVALMKNAWIVLTDSGGLQEEAPALGKPVLVLREETERPEALDAGVAKLVGCRTENVVAAVESLLDPQLYLSMAKGASPYGDGQAAGRIVNVLRKSFASSRVPP